MTHYSKMPTHSKMGSLSVGLPTSSTSIIDLSMDILNLLENIEDLDLSDLDREYSDEPYDAITRSNTFQNSITSHEPTLKPFPSITVRKQLSQSLQKMRSNKVGLNLQRLTIMDVLQQSVSVNPSDSISDDIGDDEKEIPKSKVSKLSNQSPSNTLIPNIKIDKINTKNPLNQNEEIKGFNKIRSRSPAQTPETAPSLPKAWDLLNALNEPDPFKSIKNQNEKQNQNGLKSSNDSNDSNPNNTVNEDQKSMDPQSTIHSMSTSSFISKPSDLFVQRSVRQTARLLYDLVDCTEHKLKGHTFTNCFAAKDAVSVLIENDLCLHRDHGVQLCREMESLKIIEHVLYERGAQKFVDHKDALYQWTVDGDDIDDQSTRRKRTDSELDIAFGLVHEVETTKLIAASPEIEKHLIQNVNGSLPTFTKLPATLLETLNLNDLKTIKKRHRKTMDQRVDTLVDLPVLSGWMEKQSASGLRPWQKRWVIVRRTHLLWSKEQKDTDNPLDPKERGKFSNSMTLLTINKVRAVNTKRKRKFDIVTPAKIYHFKCSTKEQRQQWLHGLQQHLNALTESVQMLRKSFLYK